MYKKVPTNLDFVNREQETLAFWNENRIFEKSLEHRKGERNYTFYDGPPTANGKPHIGHVLTRVIKDMIPRYRTMKGYKDQERTEELSNRAFSYTFTPATEQYDAIVELSFDDGQRYGGMLIPKGNLQISNKDVYMIQLYEINDKGAIIYDENGDIKSTILMWKE